VSRCHGFEGNVHRSDLASLRLEFLYLLIFGQNQARREGAADELASMTALAQRFLAEHLGAWVGPFTKAVSAGAETAFYRELGAFTDRFVRMEAANLASH